MKTPERMTRVLGRRRPELSAQLRSFQESLEKTELKGWHLRGVAFRAAEQGSEHVGAQGGESWHRTKLAGDRVTGSRRLRRHDVEGTSRGHFGQAT